MVRLPGLRKATERRPLRVLLVEDSENDAFLLLRELRRGGYEPLHERVSTLVGMERALEGAREKPWEVVDDGRGFDTGAPGTGVGQHSMRHRALEIGGKLKVEISPGRGTRVRFEGPVSRLVAGG